MWQFADGYRHAPRPGGSVWPEPASVSNLIHRAEKHLAQPRHDQNLAARIVETITKTENRV
jgi:hypothetical protein